MSNPTELPDLDTGLLIDAAEKHATAYDGDDRDCIKTDVINAFYAGAEFARRAQPEGEAPQAESYARYFAGNEATPGYPAAQHAESGAKATDYRVSTSEAAAKWAEVFYRNADSFTVRDLGIVQAAWAEATRRAALGAKAEAPAVVFTNDGAQPEDTAHLDCTACGGSGHVDDQRRAQQAAAPDAMISFRKWHDVVGDQDCEYTWMQAWTAAQLSMSASAPGTPEAPVVIKTAELADCPNCGSQITVPIDFVVDASGPVLRKGGAA
jgi:hypothetical protein